MKGLRMRRNRKHVDLVELVRNRFRFQPYRFDSNANMESRSNTRIGPNTRSNRSTSSEHLPKNQRQRVRHSRRRGMVTRSSAQAEPNSSGSTEISAPCSSRQTQRDAISQTSIPNELRHLLVDDTKPSEEEIEAEESTSAVDAAIAAAEQTSSTSTIAERTSAEVITEQAADASPSCSTEQRASAAVQAMVDYDRVEPDDTEETEDTREAEDDTEDTGQEDALDTVSADEPHEHDSDSDDILHEHRSHPLPEENEPADEEAGGDGHHNNSVIEIEITLTSGNDSNSDEEENDTDAVNDEGSEDI